MFEVVCGLVRNEFCLVDFAIDGFTPLHLSCEKGYPEITRMLLKSGASPNVTTAKHFFSSLHIAAREGNYKNIEVFLEDMWEEEIVLLCRDCYGNLPHHYLAERGDDARDIIIKMLKFESKKPSKKGCISLSIENKKGESVFSILERTIKTDMKEFEAYKGEFKKIGFKLQIASGSHNYILNLISFRFTYRG